MPLTPEDEGLAAVAELIEEPTDALIEELEPEEKEGPPLAPAPPPEIVRLVTCPFRIKCFKDHR